MRRITGGPLLAEKVKAPEGYAQFFAGCDFKAGRYGVGPFAYNETTVCLLDGDDGEWFKKQVEAAGGSWKVFDDDAQATPLTEGKNGDEANHG